jgi:putative two-component system response regulator
MSANRQKVSVLIVDHDELFRKLVKKQLTKEGFKSQEAFGVKEALSHSIIAPIDVVILDKMMGDNPETPVLLELKKNYSKAAFLMTTDFSDNDTLIACIKNGADDFLPKPFTSEELNLSIGNAIKKKYLESELREYKYFNTNTTNNSKDYLRKLKLVSFDWLITDLEAQNRYMAGHSRRVSGIALELGQLLGLNSIQSEEIRWGGLLHDVGMIAVDITIPNKPGALTNEEYRHLMLHAVLGPEIVKSVANEVILSIIRHHHDHYDGKGFEQGLKGEDIPLGARIVAIADAFDAMTNDRPYRTALPIEKAIAELKRYSGSQFDPFIVDIFVRRQMAYLKNISGT